MRFITEELSNGTFMVTTGKYSFIFNKDEIEQKIKSILTDYKKFIADYESNRPNGPLVGDRVIGQLNPEPNIAYNFHSIGIFVLERGILAKVGCQYLGFTSDNEALTALKDYLKDPEDARKKYLPNYPAEPAGNASQADARDGGF